MVGPALTLMTDLLPRQRAMRSNEGRCVFPAEPSPSFGLSFRFFGDVYCETVNVRISSGFRLQTTLLLRGLPDPRSS